MHIAWIGAQTTSSRGILFSLHLSAPWVIKHELLYLLTVAVKQHPRANLRIRRKESNTRGGYLMRSLRTSIIVRESRLSNVFHNRKAKTSE